MKFTHFSKHPAFFSLLLLLIWALVGLFVNPIGDFPLNDDFAFGRTVFNWTEQNRLLFDDWLSMTLIAQVTWGAAFCEVFGFSFTALRCSTLLISLVGFVCFFKIGKELGTSNSISFLSALLIAFNPLVFSLSYSFMSDVPFLSALLFSTFFFIKFFKTEKYKWLIWATGMALFAIFIRQLGLMLPLSFAIVWLLSGKMKGRQGAIGFLPLLISLLSLYFYQKWFAAHQGIPETYGTFSELFKRIGHENFLWDCKDRIGMLLLYTGLFLLPANIFFLRKTSNKAILISTLFTSISGLWCMLGMYNRFPWGNILFNLGLGPKLLKDGYYFINVSPTLSPFTLHAIGLFGVICGLLLIVNLVKGFFYFKNSLLKKGGFEIRVFALANVAIYGGFLLLDTHFFDRYYIPLFPFVLILLLSFFETGGENKTRKSLFIKKSIVLTFFLLMAIFSITATHDYLSWNRARWKALDYLTKDQKVSPLKIDGGYEFNGWHRIRNEKNEGTSKSWWWVEEDEYAVTFGGLKGLGFRKIKAFPYETYLPLGVDSVFILRKK